MQRMLPALLIVGLALVSTGCAPRRYYYDDGRRSDYWDHDDRQRYHGAPNGGLDLNRASIRDLDHLPGLSEKDAHRIAVNRPYGAKYELVDRRIITPRQYDRVKDYVYAGRTRDRDDDWHDDRRDDDHYRPYSRDDNRYQERRFYDDR